VQDDCTDTKRAVEICNGKQALFWDSSIVATMLRNKIDCIYTENTKDFECLGVRAVNPLR